MRLKKRHLERFVLLFFMLLLLSCHSSHPAVSRKQQQDSDPLFMEGEKEKLLGNTEKAIEIFQRYIKLFPGDGAGYYELARLKLGDYDFAATTRLMKKAVSLEPGNKYYLLLYAKLLAMSGELETADKEYEKYLKHFSAGMEIYKQYVNLLIRENKIQKAIDIFNQLEQETGISKDISMQKKDLYLMQGKMKKAIHEIEKLSAAFPDDVSIMYILADLYTTHHQMDRVYGIYQKILRTDPNDPYIHVSLADYYRGRGMQDSSLIYLKKGFLNPQLGIEEKTQILTNLSQKGEDYNTIATLSEILIRIHPNDALAYTILGNVEYHERNLLAADSAYRRSVQLNPNQYEVWEQLLFIDNETNRPDSSINDALKTIALFPVQPLPYLMLGATYYSQKKYRQAVKVLEEGKQWTLNQIELSIRFNAYLGEAYNELKNYEASDKAFDIVLLLDPDNANTLNNYAYFLALRGEKLEKAKEMAKKACTLEKGNASYLDTYAWTLFKSNEYSKAEEEIIKAMQYGGDQSAVIIEHYGDILWKTGKHEEAVKKWEEAAKLGKASPLLQKKIKFKKWFE